MQWAAAPGRRITTARSLDETQGIEFFSGLDSFFPEVEAPSGRSQELGGCRPTLAMAKARAADGAAMDAAKAAEEAAASHRETAEQKQQRIAELEERAQLFGDPVKQSAQAKVLERKWLRFLLVHTASTRGNSGHS